MDCTPTSEHLEELQRDEASRQDWLLPGFNETPVRPPAAAAAIRKGAIIHSTAGLTSEGVPWILLNHRRTFLPIISLAVTKAASNGHSGAEIPDLWHQCPRGGGSGPREGL